MVTMETKTAVKPKQPMMENGPYLEKFEQFEKGAKDPAWVRVARKAGISHFVELGFPTLRDEDWRFTNVAPIAKLPFKPVLQPSTGGLSEKALAQFPFANLECHRLVFVDGHFTPGLSRLLPIEAGVEVGSLAAALAGKPARLQTYFANSARVPLKSVTVTIASICAPMRATSRNPNSWICFGLRSVVVFQSSNAW